MIQALRSYLPHHVVVALATQPGVSPLERQDKLTAVVLFADVSGFTPLSEALACSGRRGAEELTHLLNRYFMRMIALLEAHGGIVCKFGGDAVTAIFPYTHSNRARVTRRAASCAHAMQAAMDEFVHLPSSAGQFSLAMKIGLARGRVVGLSVGDPALRLDYVLVGKPLERCAVAEQHATQGEIVAEKTLLAALKPTPHVARGEWYLLGPPPKPASPWPLPALPELSEAALAIAARYTHPTIMRRLLDGQVGFVNEQRQVTVVFVRVTELNYARNGQALSVLQAFSSGVVALSASYDGFLNRVDVDNKGTKLIVLFGTPVAHEDDAARGVKFALDLLVLARTHSLTLQIGINTGFVYCGHVGSPQRQEYTVMGDAVNLAARLMQAAPAGGMLVGAATWSPTQHVFEWASLPPLRVKGKREPVVVYRATREHTSGTSPLPGVQAPLIGRVAELRRLARVQALAYHGRGQVVALIGEAGVGKSRLVAALVEQATAQGCTVYHGTCQPYGGSYQGWSTLWRALLGVDLALPPLIQAERLAERLAALGVPLAERLPLLAGPLQLPLPPNDFTQTLDPQLRAELACSLLVECLRQLATLPLVLVLEDGHWLDPLGVGVLQALSAAIGELPVLLLLAARPERDKHKLLDGLPRQRHVRLLQLSELGPAEATLLAQRCWQHKHQPLPPTLLARVLERAQGNPLYLEELVGFVQQQPDTTDVALPDTLQQLLLSRIDLLDTSVQATLKAASVVGTRFHARWLAEGYHQLGGTATVTRQLAMLQQFGLTLVEQTAPELIYRFRHALLQEAAYASVAFATRAMLHEQLGQYLEERDAHEHDGLLDLLAYHYGRSNNHDKQRWYFQQAGDAARATYANQAAVDYYQRLLPLLAPTAQAPVLHALGEVWRLTGEWQAAEEAARQAFERATHAADTSVVAECACLIGALLARTQGYRAALPWLERAYAALADNEPQAGLSRVLEQLSFAHFQIGGLDAALAYAEQHLAVATTINDARGRCDALAQIGYVALQRGLYDQAFATQQQVHAAAEAIGYRRRVVLAASDIAEIYWHKDDLAQALEWLLRSIAEANSIGYRWVLGMMIGNAGLIYARQGDSAQALLCYRRSLALALELGNRPGVAQALGWLAALFAADAQPPVAALPVCARAIALARELDLSYELCEQLELRAELLRRQGAYAAALADCDEALALAIRIEADDVAQRVTLLRHHLQGATRQLAPHEEMARPAAPLASGVLEEQRAGLPTLPTDLFEADTDLVVLLTRAGVAHAR